MSDMVLGYAKGGITQGGQSTGVGYDPGVDGRVLHSDTVRRWVRREVDRLNDTAPAENDPHPLNEATPSRL